MTELAIVLKFAIMAMSRQIWVSGQILMAKICKILSCNFVENA